MPLLWRDRQQPTPLKRGPKQKVSLEEVVEAGISLADGEGLAAVSMRAVAQRLGVGAMSLYTYVPGRDDLVVLMVDETLLRTELPPHDDDLRTRLRTVAQVAYAEAVAHPWLMEVDGLRAWVGPGASERYEWQLQAVEGIGLDDIEMDLTVALLAGIATTAARARHAVAAAERRSGQTEAQWWYANAEALGEAIGDGEYPLASRVGQAAGELYQAAADPEAQFRFGLEAVIDGLLGRLTT